ncbi:hypothetical protein D3C73_1006460 [compost metagenome]
MAAFRSLSLILAVVKSAALLVVAVITLDLAACSIIAWAEAGTIDVFEFEEPGCGTDGLEMPPPPPPVPPPVLPPGTGSVELSTRRTALAE